MRLFISLPILMMFVSSLAQAQGVYGGAGMYVQGGAYFGQQGCAGGVSIPKSIKKIEDEQKRIAKLREDAEKNRSRIEKEQRDAKRAVDQNDAAIDAWLENAHDTNIAGAVKASLGGDQILRKPVGDICDGTKTKDGEKLPWISFCKQQTPGTYSQAARMWPSDEHIVNPDGTLSGKICEQVDFVKKDQQDNWSRYSGGAASDNNPMSRCRDSIDHYSEAKNKLAEAEFTESRIIE